MSFGVLVILKVFFFCKQDNHCTNFCRPGGGRGRARLAFCKEGGPVFHGAGRDNEFLQFLLQSISIHDAVIILAFVQGAVSTNTD